MSLPSHITYGYGGNVWIDLPARHTNAQIRIVDGDGIARHGPANATLLSVNTNINSSVSKGGYAVNVLSNAGLAVGSRVWISDDPEELLVRSVSGGTVNLRRPMVYDHANAAGVVGTRFYASVPASAANTTFWDGRVEWNIDGGARLIHSGVECTCYPTVVSDTVGVQDIWDSEPRLYDLLDREEDVLRLKDLAGEEVARRLTRLSPEHRTRVLAAAPELKQAVVAAFWLLFYRRSSSTEGRELYERFERVLQEEIDSIAPVLARDEDQDGAVSRDEKLTSRTIHLERA